MKGTFLLRAIPLLAALFLNASQAHSTVVVDVTIDRRDVFVTFSGTLNLTGLTGPRFNAGGGPFLAPALGGFGNVPPFSQQKDKYSGLLSAPSFGFGALVPGFDGTGDEFSITDLDIDLPAGYRSGADLSGSFRIADGQNGWLGLIKGDYVFALPHDEVLLSIPENTPIPLPAALLPLLGGLGVLAAVALRRRDRA